MRRSIVVAVIFSAGFLARGLWTGPAVQADGYGRGAAEPINGDVNGDGKLDVSDGIYIINYVFRGGPLPVPITCPPSGLPVTGQMKCYHEGGAEIDCETADFPGQGWLLPRRNPHQEALRGQRGRDRHGHVQWSHVAEDYSRHQRGRCGRRRGPTPLARGLEVLREPELRRP